MLGYYDGDGTRNRTIITSTSKTFLEQIKRRFNFPYNVRENAGEGGICGRKIRFSTRYLTSLGPELFNEMMGNYANSMPRKRRLFCDFKERLRRSKEARTPEKSQERKELQREWRAITKEVLERLVREMPLTQIATKCNLSSASKVTEKCRKFGISIPKKGYWQKTCWERKRIQSKQYQ